MVVIRQKACLSEWHLIYVWPFVNEWIKVERRRELNKLTVTLLCGCECEGNIANCSLCCLYMWMHFNSSSFLLLLLLYSLLLLWSAVFTRRSFCRLQGRCTIDRGIEKQNLFTVRVKGGIGREEKKEKERMKKKKRRKVRKVTEWVGVSESSWLHIGVEERERKRVE